jgi:hypothetical protein
MSEKRRHKRFVVEGIEGTLMFTTDVEILNISINGVALRAKRRLEIGREYTLKLEYKDRIVSLAGVVVWSVLSELHRDKHAENVPFYKAGMKFTDVISNKMAKLLEFIETYKLTEEHRLNVRFSVTSPDKAILGGPYNYQVKKISGSGMLIETDMPLDLEERLPMEFFPEGENPIKFMGRIASCIEITSAVPKHYDIGVEFVEMAKDDESRLKQFIETL